MPICRPGATTPRSAWEGTRKSHHLHLHLHFHHFHHLHDLHHPHPVFWKSSGHSCRLDLQDAPRRDGLAGHEDFGTTGGRRKEEGKFQSGIEDKEVEPPIFFKICFLTSEFLGELTLTDILLGVETSIADGPLVCRYPAITIVTIAYYSGRNQIWWRMQPLPATFAKFAQHYHEPQIFIVFLHYSKGTSGVCLLYPLSHIWKVYCNPKLFLSDRDRYSLWHRPTRDKPTQPDFESATKALLFDWRVSIDILKNHHQDGTRLVNIIFRSPPANFHYKIATLQCQKISNFISTLYFWKIFKNWRVLLSGSGCFTIL